MNYTMYFADITQAEELYNRFIEPYFPESEKKPLKNIIGMMRDGHYRILCLEDEGQVQATAFLSTYPGGSVYLLDYLAVDHKCRSKGYGGALLRECADYTDGAPIYIETECVMAAESEEERAMRTRRNAFYEANGVRVTPVRTCVFGMVYDNWLLSSGELPDDIEVIAQLTGIYRYFVKDAQMYEDNVFIPYEL